MKRTVAGLGLYSVVLTPQSTETFGRLPVTPRRGYEATAAVAWPGRSISGTTVMWRAAA
jgi:hypothetical protein